MLSVKRFVALLGQHAPELPVALDTYLGQLARPVAFQLRTRQSRLHGPVQGVLITCEAADQNASVAEWRKLLEPVLKNAPNACVLVANDPFRPLEAGVEIACESVETGTNGVWIETDLVSLAGVLQHG